MKNSALLRWTNNRNKNGTNGNKNWLHAPESLQKGHIAYLVKFLGSTGVDRPKGFDVVKEAIQKLSFSQQLRKAEGGKTPRVELSISVDGVAVSEQKTKRILHQYPLHRISFCADDKAEKRFFSFIAKESDAESHTCYVFVSDKLSEEITLTIGQAFDLAYRRFLETSGKELELRRQVAALQSKLKAAESENALLRQQLQNISPGGDLTERLTQEMESMSTESGSEPGDSHIPNLPPIPPRSSPSDIRDSPSTDSDDSDFNPRAADSGFNEDSINENGFINNDQIMNNNNSNNNTLFHQPISNPDDDFDPRAEEKGRVHSTQARPTPPPLIPPPRPPRTQEPPSSPPPPPPLMDDVFGPPLPAESFGPNDILAQYSEMKAGFNRGLTFGTADVDFNLDSLDPLKN